MALPKTSIVEIEGVRCTVFTETRSVRIGHDSKATRQVHVTILANGQQIASASNLATAVTRATKALSPK